MLAYAQPANQSGIFRPIQSLMNSFYPFGKKPTNLTGVWLPVEVTTISSLILPAVFGGD
jgi:hypothetical protein